MGIIKGINPIKDRPTNRGFNFNKDKIITPYNYPLSKYTIWKIHGYRKEGPAGIKKPYWITKTLPTGQPLLCPELDGMYSATPIFEGMISPQEEQKKKLHFIPDLPKTNKFK